MIRVLTRKRNGPKGSSLLLFQLPISTFWVNALLANLSFKRSGVCSVGGMPIVRTAWLIGVPPTNRMA